MKAKPAEVTLSLAVLILGIAAAYGTTGLSSAGGYARVGPNIAPAVIAGGLILVGLWLLIESLTGGWRNAAIDDPKGRGEHPFHPGAFLWVTVGLFAQILLIRRGGFVIAQALLFTGVARAFGSRRLLRDFAFGVLLALAVYLFFVKFLNVSLPAGWLEPLLGGAGI